MKPLLIGLFLLGLCSCGNDSKPPTAEVTVPDKKPFPEFAYPVVYPHWKMGDPQLTKEVIDLYRDWDADDINAFVSHFADSIIMDLPEEKRIVAKKQDAYRVFRKYRKVYSETTNSIIHAYAITNEDNNDNWVNIVTYSKWTYQDGVRDSALYADHWKFNNGKIVYLSSLMQQPSRGLLKKLKEAE